MSRRLANRLAVVERLEHGEQAGVLLDLAREGVQIPRARMARRAAPPIRQAACAAATAASTSASPGLRHRGQRLAGGGVDHLERSSYSGRAPARRR